jgi:hypothetical protein
MLWTFYRVLRLFIKIFYTIKLHESSSLKSDCKKVREDENISFSYRKSDK